MLMTDDQLQFWRALTAPFPRSAYLQRKGESGKIFTYLDSRTIENRLDDVAGPDRWNTQFHETERGVICELIIYAPDQQGNAGRIVTRAGAGGFRQLQNEDSSYKSGFTSAFRSAAARFGIGRDLYGRGMPAYCADLHNCQASGTPTSGPAVGPPPAGGTPLPAGDPSVLRPDPSNGNNGPGKPPFGKAGTKAPYAWAMSTGKHFFGEGKAAYAVLDYMSHYAESRKKPKRTDEWDEAFLDECLARTLEWIRGFDNYRGEFGEAATTTNGHQAPSRPADLSGLKKSIGATAKALLLKKTGREPSQGEWIATIGEVASSVPNGHGHRGEVLESLSNCSDAAWLGRILAGLNTMVQEAAQLETAAAPAVDDDIPF